MPARAEGLAEAWSLFCAGEYEQADRVAAALGAPEGFELASRARRVHGRYIASSKGGRGDAYDRAIRLAERGVELAPDHPGLRLELAAALGRKCALRSIRCLFTRQFDQARRELEVAAELAPGDVRATGYLGAWHARSSASGVIPGADEALGRRLMGTAEPEAADDTALLFELGRAWQDLGELENAARLYEAAMATDSPCAHDAALRGRAGSYLANLSGG